MELGCQYKNSDKKLFLLEEKKTWSRIPAELSIGRLRMQKKTAPFEAENYRALFFKLIKWDNLYGVNVHSCNRYDR